jgi:predicted nucleotidyltransferase
MSRHLEIAKRFVQEYRQKRKNLVGALLVGSAAHGEETEFSDVDLRLIVEAAPGEELDRNGIDAWREGIYIDALPVARQDYTDLEKILANPIRANDMNSGLILFDDIGQLAQLQLKTQAVFMAPHQVARRVQHLAGRIPCGILRLREAIESKDPLNIWIHAGRLLFGLALIPLIQQGIAPSSIRHLSQLGTLSMMLKERFCALEGSTNMEKEDVLAIFPIFARLTSAGDTSQWGNMPGYIVKKIEWMARNGYHREAIHAMWINGNFRANDCLQGNDPSTIAVAEQLAQDWFRNVNWEGADVLDKRLKQITMLWEDIRAAI